MAKKDLTPKQKAFKKRYLDINDQFVSYKNVQDIKNYYRTISRKQTTNKFKRTNQHNVSR